MALGRRWWLGVGLWIWWIMALRVGGRDSLVLRRGKWNMLVKACSCKLLMVMLWV
jgi:hypothetical protein